MRKKYYEKLPIRKIAFEKVEKPKIRIDAFLDSGELVIDFCEITTECKPIFRTVLKENDYANYDFRKKEWDCKLIEKRIWENNHKIQLPYIDEKTADYTEETKEIIGKFCENRWSYDLLHSIERKEENIAGDRNEKYKEKHQEKIEELMSMLPKPQKGFKKYVQNTSFKKDHVLFFKARETKGWCCRCANEVDIKKRTHNEEGFCPRCKKPVTYKSRVQEYRKDREILYMQIYNEKLVLRYFKASFLSRDRKKENFEMTESVRTYHKDRIENYENRYINYADWLGNTFWSDRMDAYHQVKYGIKTTIYAENLEEIEKYLVDRTFFPFQELAELAEEVPIIAMLLRFKDHSIYEKLYKMGLKKIAIEHLKGTYQKNIINSHGKTIKQVLGISKTKLEFLRSANGNMKTLDYLQEAEETNYGLSEDKIFEIVSNEMSVKKIAAMTESNKVLKMFHYLKKTIGYKNLKETVSHYNDYLSMAITLEYDVKNSVIRYPKNLKEQHDKMAREFYEEIGDKYIAERMKKYVGIAVHYEELKKIYEMETKDFVIMVPQSAKDIIEEGRILHHCVGQDGYLESHSEMRSAICFLRKKGSIETPYYTIQINLKTNEIQQYYGVHDKKPEKEIVDEWIKEWKAELRKRVKQKERLKIAG